MPDITTIVACSTTLGFLLCVAIFLSWLRDGRPSQRSWLFAPFAISVPAGILLAYPDILPGTWALRIGWFLLLLVYACTWQCSRAAGGRKPAILASLVPCLLTFCFSLTFAVPEDATYPFAMVLRVAVMAYFNALTAREFARQRDPQLPSIHALFWIFASFALFDLVRTPLAFFLPAPLGPKAPMVWSIVIFNFEIVMEGLLLGVFMTSLGREQVAAQHYALATIDPLTGIGNRRALDACFESARVLSPGKLCAMVAFDIDRFKTINDTHGHGFGDIVIRNTARLACDILGESQVFRIGGEEFVGLIEGYDEAQIIMTTERLRSQCENTMHNSGSIQANVTISLGLARFCPDQPYEHTLEAADNALYRAKNMGRNCIALAGHDHLDGLSVFGFTTQIIDHDMAAPSLTKPLPHDPINGRLKVVR